MKRSNSLVAKVTATGTRRLVSGRSSITVLILAILGCGISPSFSQQGHDSNPAAATSETAVQKASAGKHLIILSGQSNMVGLDPEITFTPNVTEALGKDAVIIVKDAHGGQSIRSWCKSIRRSQVEFAESYPRGAWVDTDDLNDREQDGKVLNDVHYTPEGYRLLGKRFADKAIALITGKTNSP